MNTRYYKPIIALFFVIISLSGLKGQNNTMYYMGTVPQSYYLNPATQPQCGLFIGAPVVSSLYAGFNNTGFSASDFVFKDPESDSIIHLFHPRADKGAFLNRLNDVEHFNAGFATNVASFGFRVGDLFIAFDATIKVEESFSYPKSVFELLLQGTEDGNVIDLEKLGIDILSYTEFAVNLSKNYGDHLSLGIRPKLLFGLGTVYNDNSALNLETSASEYLLNIDSEIKMAAVGATLPVDENGVFDPNGDFVLNDSVLLEGGYGKFFRNKGFGLDLGVHFKPFDQLQFSASVLDLGYINWKSGTNISTFNGSFSWEGAYFNGDSVSLDSKSILDSLKENVEVTGSAYSFARSLTPKVILGGRYFLSDGFDIGLLSKTSFYKNKTTQELTLLADLHPTKGFSVSGSYSLAGKSRSTFGLGLGLKFIWGNLYMIYDYIPLKYNVIKQDPEIPVFGGIPFPVDYSKANVRIGLNLIFGCRKAKKLKQDKPLFNSSEWMF